MDYYRDDYKTSFFLNTTNLLEHFIDFLATFKFSFLL